MAPARCSARRDVLTSVETVEPQHTSSKVVKNTSHRFLSILIWRGRLCNSCKCHGNVPQSLLPRIPSLRGTLVGIGFKHSFSYSSFWAWSASTSQIPAILHRPREGNRISQRLRVLQRPDFAVRPRISLWPSASGSPISVTVALPARQKTDTALLSGSPPGYQKQGKGVTSLAKKRGKGQLVTQLFSGRPFLFPAFCRPRIQPHGSTRQVDTSGLLPSSLQRSCLISWRRLHRPSFRARRGGSVGALDGA